MRIIILLVISTSVLDICNAKEDPEKTKKLLDLAKQIVPGMEGKSFALGEILKVLKVLNKNPQYIMYSTP